LKKKKKKKKEEEENEEKMMIVQALVTESMKSKIAITVARKPHTSLKYSHTQI
jgi:hypothetical protein